MKILVVIANLRGGGAQRVVSLLSQEWAKSHGVTIALFDASGISYDHGGRIVDLCAPPDVPVDSDTFIRKIYKSAYNIGIHSALLLSLLRRERPDRIISFMESANIPATIASTLTGRLPHLTISVHNNPAYIFSFQDRLLASLLYRLPSRVIAVSEGVKRGMASVCHLPLERISFIFVPNSVAMKTAQETTSPLPECYSYILGVGRLVPQKGFERLLQAFHRLNRPALHLAILGEGPERANLLRLARELGLEGRLHLPGHVAEVETWYRHAACFVLSSRYEGWPSVLGEALANGCPVVSFDCNYGPSEILEDGKYGLLAPEGDVEALAGAIVRVLDDDALQRDLAAKGSERAQMFGPEKIATRWLEADVKKKRT